MKDKKQQLRADLLVRSKAISDTAAQQSSEIVRESVLDELRKLNLTGVSAHVYQSSSKWKEISTHQLVQDMYSNLGYEIVQPETTPYAAMDDRRYDVIILPCIGFDAACHRIGRGRGWYDTFLATQPQALKIGLAFDAVRCDDIPLEPHDMLLDMVITERAIYTSHGK